MEELKDMIKSAICLSIAFVIMMSTVIGFAYICEKIFDETQSSIKQCNHHGH